MMRVAVAGLAVLLAGPVLAAEPIEGTWLTPKGAVVEIAACDAGFCLAVATGERAGQQIGHVAGAGGRYEGQLVNPDNGKSNAMKVEVTAEGLTLSGCAGIICGSRTWMRQ